MTLTYPVADLVFPAEMEPGERKELASTREEELMKVIRSTVAPRSWTENGGPATMQYYSIGQSLIIQQTREKQEAISKLLADLRQIQDIQVAVEIRMLTLPEGSREPLDVLRKCQQGNVTLSQTELLQLVKFVQQDKNTRVMQAPKLTIFNGQKGMLSVMDYQTFLTLPPANGEAKNLNRQPQNETIPLGFRYYVRPTVTSDQKQVTLSLGFLLSRLEEPAPIVTVDMEDANLKRVTRKCQLPRVHKLEFEKMVRIADGQTALFHLGKETLPDRSEPKGVLAGLRNLQWLGGPAKPDLPADLFLMATAHIIRNASTDLPALSSR